MEKRSNSWIMNQEKNRSSTKVKDVNKFASKTKHFGEIQTYMHKLEDIQSLQPVKIRRIEEKVVVMEEPQTLPQLDDSMISSWNETEFTSLNNPEHLLRDNDDTSDENMDTDDVEYDGSDSCSEEDYSISDDSSSNDEDSPNNQYECISSDDERLENERKTRRVIRSTIYKFETYKSLKDPCLLRAVHVCNSMRYINKQTEIQGFPLIPDIADTKINNFLSSMIN